VFTDGTCDCVKVIKYSVVVGSVVWLHILLGPFWCMCGALFGMSPIILYLWLTDNCR